MHTVLKTRLGDFKLHRNRGKIILITLPAEPVHAAYTYPNEEGEVIENWLRAYANHPHHPPVHLAWSDLAQLLRLDMSLSALRVYERMYNIPYGQTLTYGQLAEQAGTGARAVGGWCARNPFPVLIPCHRVVAADGLGEYMYGREYKKFLLHHEGAV
jgi:O-6-methylguanine DNA methyltransferase